MINQNKNKNKNLYYNIIIGCLLIICIFFIYNYLTNNTHIQLGGSQLLNVNAVQNNILDSNIINDITYCNNIIKNLL